MGFCAYPGRASAMPAVMELSPMSSSLTMRLCARKPVSPAFLKKLCLSRADVPGLQNAHNHTDRNQPHQINIATHTAEPKSQVSVSANTIAEQISPVSIVPLRRVLLQAQLHDVLEVAAELVAATVVL